MAKPKSPEQRLYEVAVALKNKIKQESNTDKRYMQIDTVERNGASYNKEMKELLDCVMEVVGGTSMFMHMRDNTSQFNTFRHGNPGLMMDAYEYLQEHVLQAYRPDVFASLAAASKVAHQGSGGAPDMDAVRRLAAKGLDEATKGMPEDVKKQLFDNMERFMGEKDSPTDEDDLLDQIL